MVSRPLVLIPLLAALVPWVTRAGVNPLSFAFLGATSLLALAVAVLVLRDESEWALHLSVAGSLAAFGSILALAGFVSSASISTLAPVAIKLALAGLLLVVSYLLIRRSSATTEAVWRERFRAQQAQRRERGLSRSAAIQARRRQETDPWDMGDGGGPQ